MIGRTISHYRIVEKIGEGGMGVVYKAEDTKLGRFVAVKFLPPALTADPDARRRFITEARSAAALNHPNIAVVHDIGETPDGQTFMVMAWYDGGTLQDRIARGALPADAAVRLVRQVASALERAHASGIIHRDVKPANILLTSEGDALLADFGLAKLAGSTRVTQAGSTVGTVQYMSPEQARGDEVDARSDLFSLGVVLYQALCAELPFRGEHPAAVMYSIMHTDAPPLPDDAPVPAALRAIVARMLARDREQRYSSARDFIRDLDAMHSGASLATSPAARRRRVSPRVTVVLAAVIVLTAAGLFWLARGRHPAPAPGPGAIAVLPLRNLSGDAGLDWMTDAIPEMLGAALSRSGDLRVLDRLRLAAMLKEAGAGGNADAIGMARQAGIATLVTGEIYRSGATIRVQSNVVDAHSGQLVHSETVQGSRDDDLFKMVASLTDALQTYLHIQAMAETVDETWIRSVTSRSLDAYRHYVRGRNLLMTSQWAAARGEFEAAIAADSTFVEAYVDLTGACFNLEDNACIGAAYEHARRLRQFASPREQLNIDLIGAIIHDQADQQIRIATELLHMDPDGQFWRYALGRGYYFSGKYAQAVQAWQPLYEQRWKWVWTNLYMSDALCHLGRFDDALSVLRAGFAIVPADRGDMRARLYRYRGRAQRDRGDLAAAAADFDSAETLLPDYPLIKYDRGILRQQQGDHDGAASLLGEFLSGNPTGTEADDARRRLATLSSPGGRQ